ncbi:hypothetical protein M427DRAFT_36325 [Gonapodya prolifera JEL478]|uniref:Chromo domain-containing protein n=1 Tax=Gonapodya prolifera (strain JEL478) TaxID=1344416 RepID=A0A139A3E3_GONPJ|nr:hypothetical protein M427DRAFT_36325 [Gonapodya prolifera JEL478]|eukprot:KXS11138.1 hypothetical protein M427DRAFT_36325 [Gonapodya prolifera JEL478]
MAQLPQHLSVGDRMFVRKVVRGLCKQPGPVWAHAATIVNVNREQYLYQLQWIHWGPNLDDVPGTQAPRWFHQRNLKPIPATMSTEDIALATLSLPGDVEDFEVEAILGFRGDAGQSRQYLVKWTGWPPSASTWEPRTNFNFPLEDIEERIPDLSFFTDKAISTLLKATNTAVLDPKASAQPTKGSKLHPFIPIAPPLPLASNLRIDFQSLMATSLLHISSQDRAAFEDEFRR